MRKRIYSVLFCVLLVVMTICHKQYEPGTQPGGLFGEQVSLNLWYTDEELTDYLNSVCLYYQEETGVRVVPRLVSGLQYLDALSESSIAASDEFADVFIVSNDALGRTYLSGLSIPVAKQSQVEHGYPAAAVSAVTYKGKQVAYPLYYETAVLLCNETYLDQMAAAAIQADADALEGEQAQAMADNASDEDMEAMALSGAGDDGSLDISQGDIEKRKGQMIPATVEELLTIADEYDAPENVEAILSWDVTDIFYNYFFVGGVLNLGGETGDDVGQITVYSDLAVNALSIYQSLNQFFSIEAQKVSYEGVLSEFMEGKTIFTIATTDAIGRLEQAKADGTFPYAYKVAKLPSTDPEVLARSMSVTYGVAVNGFGTHTEEADDFAYALAKGLDESFYEKTGKVPAKKGIAFTNDQMKAVEEEYDQSAPVPKMLETSNFWMMLEATFTEIWNGADVESSLRALDTKVRQQLGLESVEEEQMTEEQPSQEALPLDEAGDNAVSDNAVSGNGVSANQVSSNSMSLGND